MDVYAVIQDLRGKPVRTEIRCSATDQGHSMKFIRSHPWSLLSILVSVGMASFSLITIAYLSRHGEWQPDSDFARQLAGDGGLALIVSFILACISLGREKQKACAGVALSLSILSFFVYVQ